MKKFLKHLHITCATMLMATVFAVNANAAIKEENILLEIDDDGFVSYEEETYNWHEGWGIDDATIIGKVNCIKEGTKVRFSLTADEENTNPVLNSVICKLDGNTITHVSDAGEIVQTSLSADTEVEIDFSKSNFDTNTYFGNYNGDYIEENALGTNFLYVFTVSDWNDEDENQVAPEYIIRIQGDSSAAEVETTETEVATPETTETEVTTPETAETEVTTPETAETEVTTPETAETEVAIPETTETEVATPVASQTTVGNKATATPNTVSMSIADTTATMRAYSIDNTNYFSLRDIASLLNSTEKQFDIQYDKTTKTITLTTQKPYALANTDYTNNDNMAQREVTSTAITINVDGQNVTLTSYNINNINYFNVNDLAKALNINVIL
ncbi:hypothetical protein AAK894_02405 [Lachnospiraceae bacterium 46-61]